MPTRTEYAKIHIAIKELGLSEEQYRDILMVNFKETSSKCLTSIEVRQLLDHFIRLGWKSTYREKGHKRPSRQLAKDKMSRKIRALWITLHKAGAVVDSSETALGRFAQRITGIAALQWLSTEQKGKVIAALIKWSKRVGCLTPQARSE